MAGKWAFWERRQKTAVGRKQGILSREGSRLMQKVMSVFSPWNGDIYDDDITRGAIWSFVAIVSKSKFVHVRGEGHNMRTNPDADIRFVLQWPNEFMTMQTLIMKLATHYQIYNNAFAWIVRGPNGRPVAIYPLNYHSVRLEYDGLGQIFCRFSLRGAKDFLVPYADIIHLRKHYNKDDFFGDDNKKALSSVMEVISTADQGMVSAIKNSAVISWILKFTQVLHPDDIKKQVNEFSDNYLNVSENGTGVVPADPRYTPEQITHTQYVPNAVQTANTGKRILDYFGSNEKIVSSTYDENGFNAYYEKECEPFLIQFAEQLTMKAFNAIDRAHHNMIVPQSVALLYSSNATKLSFVQMVDRGAMTPNEWRFLFNWSPLEGGDVPIRRLDTPSVNDNSQPVAKTDDPEAVEEQQPKNGEGETTVEETTETRAQGFKPAEDRRDWLFETRAAEVEGGEASFIVEGRAITYEQPTLMYEENGVKYYEVIRRGALDGADMSDVPMRYNHTSSMMIVGRHNAKRPNRSTVDFNIDAEGLSIRADLSRTESGRQLYEAIKAGLVDKMSFAFTVSEESYDRETHTRSINKIKKLWDVSAVDIPAYDTTSIYARDRFAAEAQAEKMQAEAAAVRKRKAITDLDLFLTIEEQKEE